MNDTNLKKQAVELEGTRRPGQTGIYRNVQSPDKLDHSNVYGVTTLYENFQNAVKINPDGNYLGYRPYDPVKRCHGPYTWQTYRQVDKRVTNFGSGLVQLEEQFVKKGGQWGVAIYSVNRPEWTITEQAANAYSLWSSALYDTLGPSAVEFILNHCEMPVCVTSSDKIAGLLKLAGKLPKLKVVISMDSLFPAAVSNQAVGSSTPQPPVLGWNAPSIGVVLREWGKTVGIQVFDFNEVEVIGSTNPRPHVPPKPSDVTCICYTSGTTGDPKGALLTHENFVVAAGAALLRGADLDKNDVLISYLPLAHVFERLTEVMMVLIAGSIGFYRGDVLNLIDDIGVLRPTFFPSVPRLLNRVYAKLRGQTVDASGLVGVVARKAVADKLSALTSGRGYSHALWDKVLFSKVRNVLGGRVRYMISGSAPISNDILQFLRIAFCCDISEGYGQTENTAFASMTLRGENVPGHVGAISTCLELKLVDVPEMSYLSTDKPHARGEICLRGHSVFKGYLKDPKKTEEALDRDGWLHTGDIGVISQRGTLSIIDRKKNIFKLAQGEYIAPEKIEGVLLLCPLLAQVYVHGDSLQSSLVAIVVPEPEPFSAWASGVVSAVGRNFLSIKDVMNDPAVRKALLKELDEVSQAKKLRGFEIVKNVYIEPEPFSVENNFLTPSFKLKRQDLAAHYRKEIDAMYAELNAAAPASKL